jgi:arabinogalactan oligomer/maltooligosaccharide transport system substrate-binding protein
VAVLGATLALGACGSTSTPAADTKTTAAKSGGTITIWVDESRKPAVAAAAAAFEKDTGSTVELVTKNFDDIRTDFGAQVPTGKGPDITVGAHDWLGELTANGLVAPIELGDKVRDFEPVSVEAFTQDKQVYGLPYAVENVALIRNTALAPTAPATWQDAITTGQKSGAKYPILLQMDGIKGDPYTAYALQSSFGAPVFDQNADGSYSSELGLGGPSGEAFATFLAAQGKAKVLDPAITYDVAVAAFAAGQSPYIIGGPWMLEKFGKLKLAIDPIPSAGGKPAQPFVGVAGFYLNAKSKNLLTANDFLVNYMSTKDAQLALYKAGNRPPALIAAADAASADPITAGFREVGKDAVPMPSIPEMAKVWSFWGVTEGSIVSGTLKPVDGWQKMVSDIQGALDAA